MTFLVGRILPGPQTRCFFEINSIVKITKPNESGSLINDRTPLVIQKVPIKVWITDLKCARNYLSTDMFELVLSEAN